ncbi:hypothetical protein [Nonomuraea dietziae]|uniref:Uncharacterized protein n=2 Tax=Nonomuraea dietziae TaxID=65515 RepID=A0A7W5YSC4_9ACTN|nr:hypothetical protein [Nonomuraea dietziae]MBB3728844.1 hypothetical protein [Nonomuraea dietziae]
MSGSSGVAAPPRPAPPPAQRMPSPFSLPLHALRLAGKCALPLIMWFSVGEAVRFGLMYAGTEIAYGDDLRQVRLVATMTFLTLVVMTSMAVITGMLYSLRGALWEIRARQADGEADERFWKAMDRVAPTFAAIYMTWSFHREDAREFVQLDFFHNIDQVAADAFQGVKSVVGRGLIDLDWRVSLGAMAVAFALKLLFAKMVEKGTGKFAGIAAAFSEFAFVFYGLNATVAIADARAEWMEHRAVVSTTGEVWSQAKETVPGWEAVWGAVGEVWPFMVDAVVMPLTWLTVAILVFGAFADDTRTMLRGTRFERGVDRLESSHDLTQKSFDRVTGGFQERWVPLANSLRLTLKGGAALFGMMCLSYVALHVGAEYALRGVRTLVGSGTPWYWLLIGPPIDMVKELVVTVLTMALLAATFDLAATRARLSGQAVSA